MSYLRSFDDIAFVKVARLGHPIVVAGGQAIAGTIWSLSVELTQISEYLPWLSRVLPQMQQQRVSV